MIPKRANKSKKQLVEDLKQKKQTVEQVANVRRLQNIIREKIFPILVQYNQDIKSSRLFLQNASIAMDTAFNETSKKLTVESIIPRLKEIFSNPDKTDEMNFYMKLFEAGKDETLSDFLTLLESLPREIEKFFLLEVDKRSIIDVDINKMLG